MREFDKFKDRDKEFVEEEAEEKISTIPIRKGAA